MSEPWSEKQVKLLKKLVRNKTQREIAKKLGRSMKAVERKLNRLRPQGRKRHSATAPPWPKYHVKILKKLYPSTPLRQIAKQVGRSVKSVRKKAYKLGLKKTKRATKSRSRKR